MGEMRVRTEGSEPVTTMMIPSKREGVTEIGVKTSGRQDIIGVQ